MNRTLITIGLIGLTLTVGACQDGGQGLGTTQSAEERAAERASEVRNCEESHGLSKASDAEWRTSPKQIGELSNRTRVFQFCAWPPPAGADPDGYSEISVRFAEGPNTASEWPIGPNAYRITSDNCSTFAVALGRSGGTGFIEHLPAMLLRSNEIKTAEDEVWDNSGEFSKLPFFPARDEAILLSNAHYSLDGITCAGSSPEGEVGETETAMTSTVESSASSASPTSCPAFVIGVASFSDIEASGVPCREARRLLDRTTLNSVRNGREQWAYGGWEWTLASQDEVSAKITGTRGAARIVAVFSVS